MKRKPLSATALKKHQGIIRRLGPETLALRTQMTRAAIRHWEKKGIPRAWVGTVTQWAQE